MNKCDGKKKKKVIEQKTKNQIKEIETKRKEKEQEIKDKQVKKIPAVRVFRNVKVMTKARSLKGNNDDLKLYKKNENIQEESTDYWLRNRYRHLLKLKSEE